MLKKFLTLFKPSRSEAIPHTLVNNTTDTLPNKELPTTTAAISKTSGYMIGDWIAQRYQVQQRLEGGMGYVYIAKDFQQDILFAIKQPKPQVLGTPEISHRFIKEANTWITLGMHPHIANCYFVRNIDKLPTIFIEYVKGGDLSQWIQAHPQRTLKTTLNMAIQFCHGMEKAHSLGIIHRDIKTKNILVTQYGQLKVTDFGVSSVQYHYDPQLSLQSIPKDFSLDSASIFDTQCSSILGTLAYSAPEQWQHPQRRSSNNSEGVWFDSDIFSFGICLWELFLGYRPYHTTYQLTIDSLPYRDKHFDTLATPLQNLLLRCISIDRTKRYQHFSHLRVALNKVYRHCFDQDAPDFILPVYHTEADTFNNQGYSSLQLNDSKQGISFFKKALQLDKTHLQANYNFSLLQWRAAKIDDTKLLRRLKDCLYNPVTDKKLYQQLQEYIHKERLQPTEYTDEKYHFDVIRPLALFKITHQAIIYLYINTQTDKWLFTHSPTTLHYWDKKTQIGHLIKAHTENITALTTFKQGNFAISAGLDKAIRFWALNTQDCLKSITHQCQHVYSLSVSPYYDFVLFSGAHSTLKQWDLQTGKIIQNFNSYDKGTNVAHQGSILCTALDLQHNHVFSGGEDAKLVIWQMETGKPVRTYLEHRAAILCLAYDTSTDMLYSGSADNSIKIWEKEAFSSRHTLTGHTAPITQLFLLKKYLLSFSKEESAFKLWDKRNRRCLSTVQEPGLLCLAVSEQDLIIAASTLSGEIKQWLIQLRYPFKAPLQLTPSRNFYYFQQRYQALQHCLQEVIALYQKQHYLPAYKKLSQVWKQQGYYQHPSVLKIHSQLLQVGIEQAYLFHYQKHSNTQKEVLQLYASHQYPFYLLATRYGEIQCYNYQGTCFRTFTHQGKLRFIQLNHKENILLSTGTGDIPIQLWDIKKRRLIQTFPDCQQHINKALFSPDDKLLYSISWDNIITIWNIQTGELVRSLITEHPRVDNFILSHNGKFLISCSEHGEIHIWKLRNHEYMGKLSGHTAKINALILSKNNLYLFTASTDSTIRIWDLRKGESIAILDAHTQSVNQLSLSPNARFLFSASDDHTIKLWDLQTFTCHHSFTESSKVKHLISDYKGEIITYAQKTQKENIKSWHFIWKLYFLPEQEYNQPSHLSQDSSLF